MASLCILPCITPPQRGYHRSSPDVKRQTGERPPLQCRIRRGPRPLPPHRRSAPAPPTPSRADRPQAETDLSGGWGRLSGPGASAVAAISRWPPPPCAVFVRPPPGVTRYRGYALRRRTGGRGWQGGGLSAPCARDRARRLASALARSVRSGRKLRRRCAAARRLLRAARLRRRSAPASSAAPPPVPPARPPPPVRRPCPRALAVLAGAVAASGGVRRGSGRSRGCRRLWPTSAPCTIIAIRPAASRSCARLATAAADWSVIGRRP